ncbi:unnamed protein product, partial [Polarella glacialis]
VLVLCGPAHVSGLRDRLSAALGGEGGAGHRRFLAENAAVLPRLLLNAGSWPWEPSPPGSSREAAWAKAAEESLIVGYGDNREPPSPPEGRPWASSRVPLWLSSGMGPLATLGDGLWRQLSGDRGAEKSSSPRPPRDRAPPLGMRGGPLFVHERLRELSRKPLPMWPVFLAAYVARLGEAEENEEDLGRGSGDEDDDDDEDQDDEGEEEEVADDDGVLGGMDDDAEAADQNHGSRILARIAEGTQPTDLNALKQQIQDDAALLTEWRKAKQMGLDRCACASDSKRAAFLLLSQDGDKRSREEVFKNLVQNCSTYFGYSEELAEYFLQMFSAEQAIKFFEANEQHRPLTIRTNSLKARRSSLMQALTQRKVSVDPVGTWTKVGLKVYSSQVPVGATPEYLGGHYMIQSASSFVPVMALAPQQDEVILDMAAAPGGKTTYIGQLMRNTGTLFANDLRRDRCK